MTNGQRDDDEYIQFAEVIEYIVNELGCEIFFMYIQMVSDYPNFKLIQGRDYPIVKQLRDVVKKEALQMLISYI